MNHRTHATILLAHGSSDIRWTEPFAVLLEHIRGQLTSARTELAFMELAQPSLHDQVMQLFQDGYTQIDVLPLFFAAGRHLRHDVPKMLTQLQQQLEQQGSSVTLTLHQPLGMEPEVMNAIAAVVVRTMENQHS